MNSPRHVGIIVDGNRRWAKNNKLKAFKGHEYGAEKVKKLYDWAKELGVKELTLYTFSIKNFDRPKIEVDYLMNLAEKEFIALKKDPKLFNDRIKINFIGRLSMFPAPIPRLMQELMELTKDHEGIIVNFAMAYDGRAEIVDAVKKIAQDVKNGKIKIDEINEDSFSKNIYLNSDVDLLIRTSGEQRTSGFLPWQGSYSELYFCDKFWPEFEKEDFAAAIEDFKKRQRRFGK